jgi:parallel beta-helix repeat protein
MFAKSRSVLRHIYPIGLTKKIAIRPVFRVGQGPASTLLMNIQPFRFAVPTLFLFSLLLPTSSFAQGSLTPPGAPAPTMKSLDQVEPRTAINATNTPGDATNLYRITQPGSYYLTGNITGVTGKAGIGIAANGVTLDLNGFDLVGVAGALDGIRTTVSSLTNIAVLNGSIRSWGGDGVNLGSFIAFNCRLADLRAAFNTGAGIKTGSGLTMTGCTAFDNTSNGISAGQGCTITDCTAYGNTLSGITSSAGSTITSCTARNNNSRGISTGTGCTIAGCTATSNTLDGIIVTSDSQVLRSTCWSNGNGGDGANIHATGSNNRIEGNNCTSADRGIDVDLAVNVIVRNTCSGNTLNWSIAAGNVCGPILDRTAPASAAISGNSAPSSLGSTDANANYTY